MRNQKQYFFVFILKFLNWFLKKMQADNCWYVSLGYIWNVIYTIRVFHASSQDDSNITF